MAASSYQDVTTITVEVGPKRAKFHVHVNALSEVSTFFKAAIERPFIEKHEQLVKLPEDSPEVFGMFVDWVYTGQYKGMNEELLKDSEITGPDELKKFMNLFLFADMVGAPLLKKEMIDKYFKILRMGPGLFPVPHVNIVAKLYQQTMPKSCLRKLWMSLHIWRAPYTPAMVQQFGDVALACPELGADLLKEYVAKDKGAKANPLPNYDHPEDFYDPDMKSIEPTEGVQEMTKAQ